MEDTVAVGYVAKAHGIKGELLIKIFDKDTSFLKEGMALFIKSQRLKLMSLRLASAGLIVKLDGCNDRNEAELYKGSEVHVESGVFAPDEKDQEGYFLNQILDYRVLLKDEFKGKVVGFALTNAHDLIRVEVSEGEVVEVPYVDSFIIEINHLDKKLKLDCPAELFDPLFFKGGSK